MKSTEFRRLVENIQGKYQGAIKKADALEASFGRGNAKEKERTATHLAFWQEEAERWTTVRNGLVSLFNDGDLSTLQDEE